MRRWVWGSVGANDYAAPAVGGSAAPVASVPVAVIASLHPARLLCCAVSISDFLPQPTRVVVAAAARAKEPCRRT